MAALPADELLRDAGERGPLGDADEGGDLVEEAAGVDGAAAVGAEDPAATEDAEPSFFAEAAEVAALLAAVAAGCPAGHAALCPPETAALFDRFETILQRYQEFPMLVKHQLGVIIEPLVTMMSERLPEAADVAAALAAGLPTLGTDPAAASAAASAAALPVGVATTTTAQYVEYDRDAPRTGLHLLCRALYVAAKVVGHKSCTSHYPHDVRHMEKVVYCLRWWKAQPALRREWEVRYCLLLWLANLVLVPFSFASIDSSFHTDELPRQVLYLAEGFLGDASRCREGAALLLGRLMTRPDAAALRSDFFDFARDAIRARDAASSTGINGSNQTLVGGVLLAIATTLKLGKRTELVVVAHEMLPTICPTALGFADVVVTKTAVKTVQRLGLACLPQRPNSWRYQRQMLSLEANLGGVDANLDKGKEAAAATGSHDTDDNEAADDEAVPEVLEEVLDVLLRALGHADTIVRWSAAKGVGRVCERLPKGAADDVVGAVLSSFDVPENDAAWHGGCLAVAELCRRRVLLPHRFAEAVPRIAAALQYDVSRGSYSVGAHVRDAACYACWSVARAYNAADLAAHVPQLSTALVVAATCDREVNVRRAAAAALQECVGRLGNVPHGIELVTTMDFFSLASLRNAFLVVAPRVAALGGAASLYRQPLVEHLLGLKLAHWDRAVRRAAAGALGHVAALCDQTFVRASLLPRLLAGATDGTNVALRHGAIFAVAAVVTHGPSVGTTPAAEGASIAPGGGGGAVGGDAWSWSPAEIASIVEIIPRLDGKRLFRGRGGEFVRQACCALLAAVARKGLVLPETLECDAVAGGTKRVRTHAKVQEFFDESFRQLLEWLQRDAVEAFGVFAGQYYTPYAEGFHGKVVAKLIAGTDEARPPSERRGCIAALGVLPWSILGALSSPTAANATDGAVTAATTHGEDVLLVLCGRTKLEQNKDAQDAEARRCAIRALVSLAATLPLAPPSEHSAEGTIAAPQPLQFDTSLVTRLLGFLADAMDDYAVDKRGDVGSYVRIEAMGSIVALVRRALSGGHLNAQHATTALRLLVKQACEKIDRLRGVAGRAIADITALLMEPGAGTAVSRSVPAFSAFAEIAARRIGDWSSPTETFPALVGQLLRGSCSDSFADGAVFHRAVIDGLVVSIGGMSVHVLRAAFPALCAAAMADPPGMPQLAPISRCLVECARAHATCERVAAPCYVTIDKAIGAGAFDPACHAEVVVLLAAALKTFGKDIHTLLSAVPCLASLCASPVVSSRDAARGLALSVLVSRYPRVRARMGADLYTAVLATVSSPPASASSTSALPEPAVPSDLDPQKALHVLSHTQWDGTSAAVVKAARDQLYPLLGLRKPEKDAGDGVAAAAATRTDDGTYKSLVREMGY